MTTSKKNPALQGDTCQDCDGSGSTILKGIFNLEVDCPTCYGHGVVNIKNACTVCHGSKIVHPMVSIGDTSVGFPKACEHCQETGIEPTASNMVIDIPQE